MHDYAPRSVPSMGITIGPSICSSYGLFDASTGELGGSISEGGLIQLLALGAQDIYLTMVTYL